MVSVLHKHLLAFERSRVFKGTEDLLVLLLYKSNEYKIKLILPTSHSTFHSGGYARIAYRGGCPDRP